MAEQTTVGVHDAVATPDAEASEAESPDGSSPHLRPTLLLLVRHAVTVQTGPILSGRIAGIDLSDAGRDQATAIGTRLAPVAVAAIYASPIERTTRTAEAIAAYHGLRVRPLPGVIEADYGEWTGGRIEDLSRTEEWKVVQRTPSRARFPGGESIREMQARTVGALEEVVALHPGETVVVVTHADPIKAAVAHFCGMHLDHFQRLHVSPASLTALCFGNDPPGGALLLTCNSTGNLDDLPAGRSREASSPQATPAGTPKPETAHLGDGHG